MSRSHRARLNAPRPLHKPLKYPRVGLKVVWRKQFYHLGVPWVTGLQRGVIEIVRNRRTVVVRDQYGFDKVMEVKDLMVPDT